MGGKFEIDIPSSTDSSNTHKYQLSGCYDLWCGKAGANICGGTSTTEGSDDIMSEMFSNASDFTSYVEGGEFETCNAESVASSSAAPRRRLNGGGNPKLALLTQGYSSGAGRSNSLSEISSSGSKNGAAGNGSSSDDTEFENEFWHVAVVSGPSGSSKVVVTPKLPLPASSQRSMRFVFREGL